MTTFRPPAAYSPLSVGVVARLIAMRHPFDRDLFLTIYCLPYCDASGGTGTSLRQLSEAYTALSGSMTTTTRVRNALVRLAHDGLVTATKRGKGLSVCLPLTTSQHTRTKGGLLTTSQHTRTRPSRPEGSGWADRRQRVSTTADNESALPLTTSQHTRDTETLEGCPSRASTLGVHENQTAAAGATLLRRETPAALEEERKTETTTRLPMTSRLVAAAPTAAYYDDTVDRPGGIMDRRAELLEQAALLAAMETNGDDVER